MVQGPHHSGLVFPTQKSLPLSLPESPLTSPSSRSLGSDPDMFVFNLFVMFWFFFLR